MGIQLIKSIETDIGVGVCIQKCSTSCCYIWFIQEQVYKPWQQGQGVLYIYPPVVLRHLTLVLGVMPSYLQANSLQWVPVRLIAL